MTALFLIVSSVLTSAVTSAFGVGGGLMLLALMAQIMPPVAVIPVHGLVQLGSNINRVLMTLRDVQWPVIVAFLPGVVLGAFIARYFLVQVPTDALLTVIALFILYLCWGPPMPKRALGRVGTFIAAIVTTFLGMFVGATGPLVAAFIRQASADRMQSVATFSMAMSLQHAPKALVFGAAGFVFHEWLGLVAAMIVSGALGTWLGLKLLHRLDEKRFTQVFNTLLTLLALRLVYQAWFV